MSDLEQYQKVATLLRQAIAVLEQPPAITPRKSFSNFLAKFQAKVPFDLTKFYDDDYSCPFHVSDIEDELLWVLHETIMSDFSLKTRADILPFMVKKALQKLNDSVVGGEYNINGKHPFVHLKLGPLKSEHLMTLWSKLSQKEPPTFTSAQEASILDIFDILHTKALELNYQFPWSYMLCKICQLLRLDDSFTLYLIVGHKNFWLCWNDQRMKQVFKALGYKWTHTLD